MKVQIQAIEFKMPTGTHTATIADINIISDNMRDEAAFSLQLQTADEVNIDGQLRTVMSGTDYANWDNSNEAAINFVLTQNNLQHA